MTEASGPEQEQQIDPAFVQYLLSGLQLAGASINPEATVDDVIAMAAHVPGLLSRERYTAWRTSLQLPEPVTEKAAPLTVTVPASPGYQNSPFSASKTAHRALNKIKTIVEKDREEV